MWACGAYTISSRIRNCSSTDDASAGGATWRRPTGDTIESIGFPYGTIVFIRGGCLEVFFLSIRLNPARRSNGCSFPNKLDRYNDANRFWSVPPRTAHCFRFEIVCGKPTSQYVCGSVSFKLEKKTRHPNTTMPPDRPRGSTCSRRSLTFPIQVRMPPSWIPAVSCPRCNRIPRVIGCGTPTTLGDENARISTNAPPADSTNNNNNI